MIRVRAPSRIHFGLLSLPSEERWTNYEGEPTLAARRFGSVGLMVHSPGVQLSVRRSRVWLARGPLAARAIAFAQCLEKSLPPVVSQPHQIEIEYAAPEHMGLGAGTQLALAVARALAVSSGLGQLKAVDLAQLVGRGLRSALGIHGFEQGGFLVEAGKGTDNAISPLVARLPFPDPWRVVLVLPPWDKGLHGEEELEAFRQLQNQALATPTTEALCRLVLLGLLPALAERDWQGFGEAVYDFSVRVGAMFTPVQGAVFADPRLAEIVAWIRRQGIPGVGQSSWGPALFAIAQDEDQATRLAGRLRERLGLAMEQVVVTQACNTGAVTHCPGKACA